MTDLLYGRNAVREALRADRKIMRLIVAEPVKAGASSHGTPPPGKRGEPSGKRGEAPRRGGRGGTPVRGGKAGDRPGATRSGGRPRSLPVQETRAERRTTMVAGRAPL